MSVGKDVLVVRRSRVGLQGVLMTCAKHAGPGVIARRMHPSVGQFKGYYNGSAMTMVDVKHNQGCTIRATHNIASARISKVRWNFITVEPAVKMLRDVQA